MVNTNYVYDSELNKITDAISSLSTFENGKDMIKSILLQTIEKYSDSTNAGENVDKKPILKFTKEEMNKMPRTFKKLFTTNHCTAHVYKKRYGKKAYIYEVRMMKNRQYIIGTAKTLEEAKAKFIANLNNVDVTEPKSKNKVPVTFYSFSKYYFENFRKPKVAPLTYTKDWGRFMNHLKPAFEETKIKNITPKMCQDLIQKYKDKEQFKTADELHSLLSIIFKGAILHNIITQNPLNLVLHTSYERKHGTALTKLEEKQLMESLKGSIAEQSMAIMLYCGLRPNELPTASIDGKFIVAKNSKRKNGKIEYKKIPISVMLQPYLNTKKLRLLSEQTLRKKFKEVMPKHILYDLRTTFYTRCEECGVADIARNEFVGHSNGVLGNTYTDLSDEFLLKEGEKLNY